MQESLFETHESLAQVADRLVASCKEVMRQARSEEDLRIGFEKALDPLLHQIGVASTPKYEKTVYTGGRVDALHGRAVIEYERPNAFRAAAAIRHTYNQLIEYMPGIANAVKDELFIFDPKPVGVGFDGNQIIFVHYVGDKTKAKTELSSKDFSMRGPFPFNQYSSLTLLTYLRALKRKPLNAENLAEVFGPRSKIAPSAVSAFVDAIKNWGNERTKVYFNEWKRLFGIVYGTKLDFIKKPEQSAFYRLYSLPENTDFQELLFCVHTYFALLMKFIAAEIITLRETTLYESFSEQLTHSSPGILKKKLSDIEEGGIYAKRGITNFLEGDFFCWYLDAMSPNLLDTIREIARGISEFEPATTTIEPDSTRDLLKKLYQYLVPKEIRHDIGEYYTPDWLAELIINEIGYDGDTSKRLLDPACGSGTFIVLAIKLAKQFGKKKGEPVLETVKKIISNIWGFDLNPLAVIAARTNYLFALGEIVEKLAEFEIPIYLADSVLWPERAGQIKTKPTGDSIEIQTSLQIFYVPKIWVRDKGFLMKEAAPLVERMVRSKLGIDEAFKQFKKHGLVFPPHEEVVKNFYLAILELEKNRQNGIWARFLKNAFAPSISGRFDFVVGNPPWIRWDFLSDEYRKATLQLWKEYGLFSLKGFETRLGGAKKDFSMLFTYASVDYYLVDGGKLGFLITQEVFKSKGAGEGFRRFKLGAKGKPIKILKAHDLVSVQPFEGAANKTAAILIKKGEETEYPINYYLWTKNKKVGKIHPDSPWSVIQSLLTKKKLEAKPIDTKQSAWQTIDPKQHNFEEIKGKNIYIARSGAYTSPYGVFWITIKQVLSDGNLIVENLPEAGKRIISKITHEIIESDLVYPVIRGADIERWNFNQKIYALITQDPKSRSGYPESIMKDRWSRTYGFLLRFQDILVSQAAYKKYHAESNNPFYSQYNIGEYTFERYKTVWKQMTNDIFSCVISQIKTPIGFKSVVPLHTTAFFASSEEDEAHYLCALINSKPVRVYIKSFSSAGRGFGTPSVMQHVGIPKFDPENELHQELAIMSKTLHELTEKGEIEQVARLERENDKLVNRLFNIT